MQSPGIKVPNRNVHIGHFYLGITILLWTLSIKNHLPKNDLG